MNPTKHYKKLILTSGALVLISWILIATIGLKPGIDLQGGAEWHIKAEIFVSITEEGIKNILEEVNPEINAVVKEKDANKFIIRLPETPEETHRKYLATLKEKFGSIEDESFINIGPTISSEVKSRAIRALIVAVIGIALYITWVFRKVSTHIPSWKYGVVTLITLLHDISIPAGFLAILGALAGIEIDTNFIVALLVILGYSVNDTIVVFDRTRENLELYHKKKSKEEIINMSVSQSYARSINTSLTLICILLALIILGPPTLLYFILTILIGTIVGTYSSLFLASPLIYQWTIKSKKYQKE
jgi:preprotein translocase subunit SecF